MGERPPHKALFWRRSEETLALRRNPLSDAALRLDFQSVVTLDVMHTLCLGVHAQFVLHALRLLVDKLVPLASSAVSKAKANRHQANMGTLRKNYQLWTTKRSHPHMQLTPIGDLTLEVLGTEQQPALQAKAHETLTLLRWWQGVATMPEQPPL